MHEFGHLVGLDDLYEVSPRYYHYFMGYGWQKSTTIIPSADVKYLEQVYRHHGGKPH